MVLFLGYSHLVEVPCSASNFDTFNLVTKHTHAYIHTCIHKHAQTHTQARTDAHTHAHNTHSCTHRHTPHLPTYIHKPQICSTFLEIYLWCPRPVYHEEPLPPPRHLTAFQDNDPQDPPARWLGMCWNVVLQKH